MANYSTTTTTSVAPSDTNVGWDGTGLKKKPVWIFYPHLSLFPPPPSLNLSCEKQFNNLKLQTSTLSNHHLDTIKQLKELQFRILEQELNRWKREQQLSGNGAPFANNLDQIQKWCEDLAEIIWMNQQQVRQLARVQEGLNIPSQDLAMNILPELSEGLNMLMDTLVKK